MSTHFKIGLTAMIVLILVAACGKVEPTTTPVSSTNTPVSEIVSTPSEAVSPTVDPLPTETSATEAKRLVKECVQAMGGMEKIDALETMRTVQHWPDHGLVRYEIKRPNLVKMGDTLVFDGERAAWLNKTNADGMPELVPAEEWKDFEMDIGWFVPAFFDHPAEYLGTEVVDNIETHILRVTLPLGAVMTYNLDAETHLVYRAASDVTIGDQEFHMERTYSDYRVHDGILYPHAFTYAGRDGVEVLTATMDTLEFNVPFEDDHFSIPLPAPIPPTASSEPSAGTVLLVFGQNFIHDIYTVVRPGLEEAGYQVVVASRTMGLLKGKNVNQEVDVDLLLEDVRVEDYDAILFNCDNDITFGSARAETDRIAQEAVVQGKVLAGICSGPRVLAYAQVVEGKKTTGEPSETCRMLEQAGATCTGAPVEQDGLIVTARDRYASRAFVEAIIETLQEQATAPLTGNASEGLIAFVSTRDGNGEIYVMNSDGSDVRRLTNWPQWDGYPTWSPDGKQIAYYSYLKDKDWVIKVMDVDGGNTQQLTDNGICDGAPHWSPDGTRIAYSSDADCTAKHREIYVVTVPDGTDAGGNSQTNLTQNDADDMGGSWSPDSKQIVFSSDRDGDYELYVMNADGSNVRQLTENDAQDLMADWSPAGTQIIFVSDRDGNDESQRHSSGIYVMDVDGNNVQQLTDHPGDWFPFWSPDGSQIVFNSKRDGNLEIYVMDADGSNVQRLTDSPAEDFNAVWQPGPAGGEAEPTTLSSQPSPETRTRPADGMIMVHVPGGTFLMGSTEAQIDIAKALCDEYPDDYGKCKQSPFDAESPQHPVTLDSFWLDRTEVTNAQYGRCVADGVCRASRLADDPSYNGDDYPVAGIPWQDATDYCAWVGGRLPTEAEWEYAARGVEGAIFPWGHEFECAGGNFWDDGTGCDDGYPEPAPVGSFPGGSSWCGALDMAGNVWEWVADAYDPYPAEAQVNPTGPESGSERILRGGSWGYLPAFSRTAYRYPVPPTADYLAVGFRCAASAGD